MKKFYFLFVFCAITGVSFAQLKVANTGKVGINIGTSTPSSNLSVNAVGNSNSALFVKGATNGIWAERSGTPGDSWIHSVVGHAPVASGRYNIGLRGQSYLASPLGSGRAWGGTGYSRQLNIRSKLWCVWNNLWVSKWCRYSRYN